jgi:hypothetical protein
VTGSDGLTNEERALVADLRRALGTASHAFAVAVGDQDWAVADKWAAIGFGLVELMQGEPADA